MSAHQALIAVVWVLIIAGGLGLGAFLTRSRSSSEPHPRPDDDDDDLDAWFGGLWWMRY